MSSLFHGKVGLYRNHGMSKVEFVVQKLHGAEIWKMNNFGELGSLLRLY